MQELTLLNKDIYTKTSLILPDDITEDQTIEIGKQLAKAESGVQWWIGDLWNIRQQHGWGNGVGFADEIGVNYESALKHGKISGRWEMGRRLPNLSHGHHVETAYDNNQDELMTWASDNKASISQLRSYKKQLKTEAITENNKDLPVSEKSYRIIYADPPWKYGDERTGLDGYSAAIDHYPTMSIEEMCEQIKVKDMAQDDAVLFMWVTSPLLYEAYPLFEAWGFEYKACFVWDKVKHNVGHYNSARHEFLLICTRGSCTPDIKKLHDSVVEIERSEKHSEKPEYFRDLIDSMYPFGDRVELFRRGDSPNGWDIWGNQADG